MKFHQLLYLVIATAVFAIPITNVSAQIVTIDFTTDTGDAMAPGTTGDLLDVNNTSGEFPLTFDVVSDTTLGLEITIESISSFDSAANPDDTSVNGVGGSFGINSPTLSGAADSEEPSRFDVDSSEVLVLSFNRDVIILNADFTSLSGSEEFDFNGITVTNDNTPTSDLFDFTDGGATTGIVLDAGDTITLQAGGPAGSEVGLQSITVDVAAIPEPSSLMALFGMAGLFMMRRRN